MERCRNVAFRLEAAAVSHRSFYASLIAAALLVASGGHAAGSPAITGDWLTEDGKAVVVIARCGRYVCGTIARVLDRAAPRLDQNNPDPKLRSRSIVGTQVLTGFTPVGDAWHGGRAYDPKSGRSYRATLQLDGGGGLKVTGCLLFLCRSVSWTRSG